MKTTSIKLSLAALVLACCVPAVLPQSARACSIPVFRYAIERWAPGSYEAIVFHRGPLGAADKAALAVLADADRGPPINLSFTTVDLDAETPDPASQTLWEAQKGATAPWLVLRSPDAEPKDPPVYAGPLDAQAVAGWSDSPARRAVAERLLKGESAVWVLLESGDRAGDDAAAKLLAERLKVLERERRLPEFADGEGLGTDRPGGPGEPGLLSKVPLALRFSMLRVSPSDPAEARFADLLRHAEPELKKAGPDGPPQPVVFPVFGRGRVLCGLAGKNITPETIDDCAAFLIGECSCQVKELNPGADLLLRADWESFLHDGRQKEPEVEVPDPVIGSGKPKFAKPPAAPQPRP